VAPTKVVGATAIVPAQPDFDDLVGRLFGPPPPVRAFVQNGNGSRGSARRSRATSYRRDSGSC
jgi:hypothetical protein